jgi:hypothetical protein
VKNPDAWRELDELLRDSGVRIKFGLVQQGHIPTIERMLKDGATWDEIGKEIGWYPPTAREWYERYRRRKEQA